ncbi:hypothetical protein [Pseudomonas koreensis]|uniref:hypothetical protein n=1 Tax=Pseudomonas koreensis TaxID=198620 RepID=UPI0018E6B8D8|nr:hypothetical protein [Pseudomonas koreensis]MBI6946501.1 hypothetical protein [Pseudomonas koreensis]
MSIQKKIPRKVWWGLEAKSYTEIAQELPSNDSSIRKWAAIYAVYHLNFENRYPGERYYSFLEESKNSKFVFIEFTLPTHVLETRDSIGASDTTITKLQTLETEDEINDFLEENQINPELFTPPWNCDYPLD